MIQANKLMIGNLIIANNVHGGKIMTIKEFDNNCAFFNEHDTGEYLTDLIQIRLTNEWLTNMGFKKTYESPWGIRYTDSRYPMYEVAKKWNEQLPEDSANFMFIRGGEQIKECRFVHTIQNLYFALTDSELKQKGEILNNMKTAKQVLKENYDVKSRFQSIERSMEIYAAQFKQKAEKWD